MSDTGAVPTEQLDRRPVLVVIGALLLGMLLAALEQTIVATALPTIAGVVLLIDFVAGERRAAEAVLPLRLFSNRVFSATSAVGFAMFGAITYLPQYMQVVRGASPTGSGLQLLSASAGLGLDPRCTWALFRLDGRSPLDLAGLGHRLGFAAGELDSVVEPLAESGLITLEATVVSLTPDGQVAIERLVSARRALRTQRLGAWSEEMDADLANRLDELARDLLRDSGSRAALLAPIHSKFS